MQVWYIMRYKDSIYRGKTHFIILFLLTLACQLGGAEARERADISALMVDAQTGRILTAYMAEEKRHPASLAKLMTLYIMMEDMVAGRLHPLTELNVSRAAVRQPASKLGLRFREKITAQLAMQALVVKSANDVAIVVAEHIAGSKRKFVARMNKTSARLNMADTYFHNPSGLHHPQQVTTAQDIALLGLALLRDFPQFSDLWSQTEFTYKSQTYRTHNHLLTRLPGSIGMKTGYIAASGYNIVTAVERNGRTVLAVIIGAQTAPARDRLVSGMVNANFHASAAWEPTQSISPQFKSQHAVFHHQDEPQKKKADAFSSQKQNNGQYAQMTKTPPIAHLNENDMPRQDNMWTIQIGAFREREAAVNILEIVYAQFQPELKKARYQTLAITVRDRQIYRARFAGLTKRTAHYICGHLQRQNQSCFEIAP